MDFEVEFGREGEKHPLSMAAGGEKILMLQDLKGGGRAVAVDPGLGMGFDGDHGFIVKGGPLTAGKFDFG